MPGRPVLKAFLSYWLAMWPLRETWGFICCELMIKTVDSYVRIQWDHVKGLAHSGCFRNVNPPSLNCSSSASSGVPLPPTQLWPKHTFIYNDSSVKGCVCNMYAIFFYSVPASRPPPFPPIFLVLISKYGFTSKFPKYPFILSSGRLLMKMLSQAGINDNA